MRHVCIWQNIRQHCITGFSDQCGIFEHVHQFSVLSSPSSRRQSYLNRYSQSQAHDALLKKEDYEEDDVSVCCVCFDGRFTDKNPIIFCDACNIGVHRYCYGIRKIPNEVTEWFCQSCQFMKHLHSNHKKSKEKNTTPPQCCLCPITGGALKRTKEGGFVHVSCAIWIDGIQIGDIKHMDPILNVAKVIHEQHQERHTDLEHRNHRKTKHKQNKHNLESVSMMEYLSDIDRNRCSICKQDGGAFIQCSHELCHNRFHVLCAWFNGQYMTMGVDPENDGIATQVFCIQHTPTSVGGTLRNFEKFRLLRRQGLTQNNVTAQIHRRERMLNQMIDNGEYQKLSMLRDTYLPERCAVCFNDYVDDTPQYKLIQCRNCGISVHQVCYGVSDRNNENARALWYCDPCRRVPEYAKSVRIPQLTTMDTKSESYYSHDTSSVNTMSATRSYNTTLYGTRCENSMDGDASLHVLHSDIECEPDIDAVQCVLCPRKGGALKLADHKYWVHLACIPYISGVELRDNKIIGVHQLLKQRNKMQYRHKCFLCHQDDGYTVECCKYQPTECNLHFHVLCGIFSGCFMRINPARNDDEQDEIVVFCRKHTPILKAGGELHHMYEYMKLLKLRKVLDEMQCIFYILKHKQFVNSKLIEHMIEQIQRSLPKIPSTPSTPTSSQLIVPNGDDDEDRSSPKRKRRKRRRHSSKQEMDEDREQESKQNASDEHDDDDEQTEDATEEYLDLQMAEKYKLAVVDAYKRLMGKLQENETLNDDHKQKANHHRHRQEEDEVYVPPIGELQTHLKSAQRAVELIYNSHSQQTANQTKQMNSIHISNMGIFKQFYDTHCVNQLIASAKYINQLSSKIFNQSANDADMDTNDDNEAPSIHLESEYKHISSLQLKQCIQQINERHLTEHLRETLRIQSDADCVDDGDINKQRRQSPQHVVEEESEKDGGDTDSYDEDKDIDVELARKITKCKHCGRKRNNWSITVWLKHLNNKHLFRCDQCPFKTTKSQYLKEHELSHNKHH